MGTAWTYATDPNDEHDAVRERAGMFDMSPLKKVFERGQDGMAVLDYLAMQDMSRIAGQKCLHRHHSIRHNSRMAVPTKIPSVG